MRQWHIGEITGAIAVGDTFFLERRPGLKFGWRTDRLEPNYLLEQTPVAGPAASGKKRLVIEISELDDGRSRIDLLDEGWQEDDPHLPLCNSYWGETLTHLRDYVERIAAAEVTV